MGQITLAGTTYNDATQALSNGVPVNGIYYPTGEPPEWGEPPCAGPTIYDRRRIKFPGVPWTGEKDFLQAMTIIYVDLIVFNTLTGLRTATKALFDALMTNTRYTVTINGTSYAGCKLDARSVGRGHRINMSGGKVGEKLPLVFNQLSDTN